MKIIPDLWQSKYTGAAEVDAASDTKDTVTTDLANSGEFTSVKVDESLVEAAGTIAFVDGVERIDMHAFVEEGPSPYSGIFASTAIGAICLNGAKPHGLPSSLGIDPIVERYFVTNCKVEDPTPIVLRPRSSNELGELRYLPIQSTTSDTVGMRASFMSRMSATERTVATTVANDPSVKYVISDGFLNATSKDKETSTIVGLIKSIQKLYLPAKYLPLLGELRRGERTKLFTITTNDGKTVHKRMSYYIRLADGHVHSMMANLARVELPDMSLPEAMEKADITSAIILHYSSNLYADTRAPQNLYPIGALEDVLKNRLGNIDIIRNRILSSYSYD